MSKIVSVRLVLLLLASFPPAATAFQLSPRDNLVSPLTTYQQPPPHLDNKNDANTQRRLQNELNPTQSFATRINRIVNRNTKNRQNTSTCSFDAPHSTHQKNSNSIQRSLRQLGITIATSVAVFIARGGGGAASAATPLIVTHPVGGAGSAIAISPLHYAGANIGLLPPPTFPPPTVLASVSMKGLSLAIGELIMSFAYVIIAIGIASALGNLAENGHVKLLKLMAWQYPHDEEDATATDKKKGGSIQGFISGYSYMIRLIFLEIRKAYKNDSGRGRQQGHQLIPATKTSVNSPTTAAAVTATAPSSSSSSTNILSRYAYLLNLAFQEIFKAHQNGRTMSSRLSNNRTNSKKEMNWGEYSTLLWQKTMKNNNKNKIGGGNSGSRSRKRGMVYNKYTMMFERVIEKSSDSAAEEATKKATDLFKQKQYEQHHHRVHVVLPRGTSQFEETTKYLDSLAVVGEEDAKEKDLLVARTGSGTKGYLDTLSDASWKMSTWEVYKGQVENAKEVQLDEIDYLKKELAHIQSLLQDEQSMYQTSNQALNLVLAAQNEELKFARAASSKVQQYSSSKTEEELDKFDIKAKEYEEAMKESNVEKSSSSSTASPHEWIF